MISLIFICYHYYLYPLIFSFLFYFFFNKIFKMTYDLFKTSKSIGPNQFVIERGDCKILTYLSIENSADCGELSIYCGNWNWTLKINANAFPKNENVFANFKKMHLQNPQFCFGRNFANAFPKSKVKNAFFSRVANSSQHKYALNDMQRFSLAFILIKMETWFSTKYDFNIANLLSCK